MTESNNEISVDNALLFLDIIISKGAFDAKQKHHHSVITEENSMTAKWFDTEFHIHQQQFRSIMSDPSVPTQQEQAARKDDQQLKKGKRIQYRQVQQNDFDE